MDRQLSPTETVRRFGVSIKALRLYEQRGLLAPQRSQAGWRTYGPAQIARLHQILALKRLGLPLSRIAELLAGRDDLDSVLALQERALSHESQRASRALALVRAARGKLASGQALSIDDLANLTKETVMTKLDIKEVGKVLKPFAEGRLSADEKAAFRKKLGDPDKVIQAINGLIAEAQALMETGDHASPAAQDVARRWTGMKEQIAGDNPDISAKGRAVWDAAMADPSVAEKLELNRKIFAFMDKAIEHWKSLAK